MTPVLAQRHKTPMRVTKIEERCGASAARFAISGLDRSSTQRRAP